MQSVEAIVDTNGDVKLLADVSLSEDRRAIVTILDESPENFAERKKKLFEAFRKLAEKDVFPDINDPVEWQRELRNEWER